MVDEALADGRLVAPFEAWIPARDAHFVISPAAAIDRSPVRAFKAWLLDEARGRTGSSA